MANFSIYHTINGVEFSLTNQPDVTFEIVQLFSNGIEEAPIDGKQYTRKDGTWSENMAVGGGHTIQSNGTDVEPRTKLNFKGVLSATDNPTDGCTDIEVDLSGKADYSGELTENPFTSQLEFADVNLAKLATNASNAKNADVAGKAQLDNDDNDIVLTYERKDALGSAAYAETTDFAHLVDGKVPSTELPSFVDDVLEVANFAALPVTGESGKIYITIDTNTSYRWSGTAYVSISNPLDYATQLEAETGTENTKVMTALRVVQSWYYQAKNYVISELNTVSKTLVGAINELITTKQNLLPFPITPIGDVLSDDGTFKPATSAVGGYANNLYFSFENNSIPNVKILSYIPDVSANTLSLAVTSGEGDKLFQSFIYPDAVSTTQIPSGLWSFALYGYVSSATGATYVGARYYKYSALGVKTYLFPSIVWCKDEVNNLLATANYIPIATVQLAFNVDPTDRMGCDLFIKTSGASRTVSIFLGDGNASYLNNPNAIRHTSLRAVNQDLTVQHIDSTSEKITPIDADKLALWDSVALKFVSTRISDFKEWLNSLYIGIDRLNFNNLNAAVGAATYPLIQLKQNSISGTLVNSVNSTLTIEAPTSGKRNETILHFSTNAVAAPTFIYSGFTPVWLGGTALSMKVSKKYTIVFEQVEVSTGVWIVKTSWGEY